MKLNPVTPNFKGLIKIPEGMINTKYIVNIEKGDRTRTTPYIHSIIHTSDGNSWKTKCTMVDLQDAFVKASKSEDAIAEVKE